MGFSFKGIHSDDFSWLGVKTVHNEILPQAKEITVESDFIDGDLDFSESLGHLKYDTRVFEKELFLIADNSLNVNKKAKQLINWLSGGYGDLILDENPELVWKAKVSNQIDFEPQLKTGGKVVVYFKAQPLGRSKNKVTINVENGKADFINNGWFCKPVVNISGKFSNLKIKLNDTTLNYYQNVSEKAIIDYEKMTIIADNSNVTIKSYGDFGEIVQGENNIEITATGEYNANLEYYPLYLW